MSALAVVSMIALLGVIVSVALAALLAREYNLNTGNANDLWRVRRDLWRANMKADLLTSEADRLRTELEAANARLKKRRTGGLSTRAPALDSLRDATEAWK
jgi:biopolymer transport protein ExbB/TolQ